ncbi:MAG: YggS family pyridoxal phosphate-dependent enzyme [Bacteroidaceae bacterium]|nr:YggS family pyridoxal phosphate-dependent enzyme [Bacteroidaceae bacterium]
MSHIEQALSEIRAQLTERTRLVAVSKFHPAEMIEEAYRCGQRIFGESHVQELQEKHAILPDDIEWHFIGHLQTNKVKYIAPYVSLIHSVDSPRLLHEIDRQGARFDRRIPCLLQLHIAREETKFGFSPEELIEYLQTDDWRALAHVELRGLMCMASNVDDEAQIDGEFALAYSLFQRIKGTFFSDDASFCECSWGMSGDYLIALRHGSTLIRVGSMIFGERDYNAH